MPLNPRFSFQSRKLAFGFAALCTGLGWTAATLGHFAAPPGARAALILVVITFGIAVLFTSLAISHANAESRDPPLYDWRTLPFWLAMAPMATFFIFGPSWLGVGVALFFSLVAPLPDLRTRLLLAAMEEDERDKRTRYRPKVLDAGVDNAGKNGKGDPARS